MDAVEWDVELGALEFLCEGMAAIWVVAFTPHE
jgi:hypothetical protein